MLRIYLFGHLRLFDDDRLLKVSAPPKTLPLLAYLLLNRAGPQSRDRLAARLWLDENDREARANLRRHLHHLQRALPPAPAGRPWWLAEPGTLQWNPEAACWLDVAEFERLSAEPPGLADAALLYTGDLLPDFYDDWVLAERERLRSVFFDVLGHLMAARRAAGDFSQAAKFAQQALQHDPLREDALRELMEALYASGERAGALQAYRRFEERLRDELGVAPLPETQALYAAIRAGEKESRRAEASAPPPARPAAPSHNLPAPLTSFVGREAELADLRGLVAAPHSSARLVTITGPGGVGKSRVALEAAARLARDEAGRFPDGVWYVALSEIRDPALAAGAIGERLGVSTRDGRPPLDGLKDYLQDKATLLLLDNFEQVIEAAPLVADLLQAAPGLSVLVTSREPLRLYGEHEYSLPPLALPDRPQAASAHELAGYAAVALFVERARAVQPAFALAGDNSAAVAEICSQLDGLPLAIELAAARSKMFAPQALLARLSSRLTFLDGRSRAHSPDARYQTLRGAIDWSFNLLNESEQTLFARLGVFVGGFSLPAAEHIAGEQGSAGAGQNGSPLRPLALAPLLDLLASLVDKNMLLSEAGPDGEPFFRMLVTLREHALERLATLGEADSLRARHARYFVALAETAGLEITGGDRRGWLERLDLQHDNLRAAFEWCQAAGQSQLALRLIGASCWYWQFRAHGAEGRAWAEAALKPAGRPAADDPAQGITWARALWTAGSMAWFQSDYLGARTRLELSVAAWRAAGPAGQPGLAVALEQLGLVALYQGRLAEAFTLFEESVALGRQTARPWELALILQEYGLILHRRGDPAAGRAMAEESLSLFSQLNDRWGMALALLTLGLLAGRQGEFAEARSHLEAAQAYYRAEKDVPVLAEALHVLGQVAHRQGEPEAAGQFYAETLAIARDLGDRAIIAEVLHGVGALALARGQPQPAARLLASAQALWEAVGGRTPWSLLDQAEIEQHRASTQAALDEAGFSTAWADGRVMTISQAVAYAEQVARAAPDQPQPPGAGGAAPF